MENSRSEEHTSELQSQTLISRFYPESVGPEWISSVQSIWKYDVRRILFKVRVFLSQEISLRCYGLWWKQIIPLQEFSMSDNNKWADSRYLCRKYFFFMELLFSGNFVILFVWYTICREISIHIHHYFDESDMMWFIPLNFRVILYHFMDEPDNRNFLSNIIAFQKFTDNYNSLSSELAYISLTIEDNISELM